MKDYSANYDKPKQDVTTSKEFFGCLFDKVPCRWEVEGHCAEADWEQAPTNGMIFAVEFSRENDLFSKTAGIYIANQGHWWAGDFENIPNLPYAIRFPFWDVIWNKLHQLTTSAAELEDIRRGKIILAITKSPG